MKFEVGDKVNLTPTELLYPETRPGIVFEVIAVYFDDDGSVGYSIASSGMRYPMVAEENLELFKE